MERRYSKLRGTMRFKWDTTHEVLEELALWALVLVPPLEAAGVVPAGVVPAGVVPAGVLAAGVLAAGVLAAGSEAGAEAVELAQPVVPGPTVTVAGVN